MIPVFFYTGEGMVFYGKTKGTVRCVSLRERLRQSRSFVFLTR